MPEYTKVSRRDHVLITYSADESFRGAHVAWHDLTFEDGNEIARHVRLEPLSEDDIADVLPDHAAILADLATHVDAHADKDKLIEEHANALVIATRRFEDAEIEARMATAQAEAYAAAAAAVERTQGI